MSEPELVLQRGLNKAACRGCKRIVTWAHTESGAKAPWDRDDQGEYIMRNGVAHHVGPASPQLDLLTVPVDEPARYTNHFVTCPKRDMFRGRK